MYTCNTHAPMQLWSHVYRQDFHAQVDTDNFTESFNNVLKNHYLTLRHDKSVFSLSKILLHCVFPDQEREYTILTTRQTAAYRKPRNEIPTFLLNRPVKVQSACLANMEKAKQIPSSSITELSHEDGVYKVNSHEVRISDGNCSCPYFQQERIPCKHIFSVFNHFGWTWTDLPKTLTEDPYLTLDTCVAAASEHILTSEQLVCDGDPSLTEIPRYQPNGARLLSLQKQTRDTLAKCSAAVFMVPDINVLEQFHTKVNDMYSDLVKAMLLINSPTKIPTIKCLMTEEIAECRQKMHLVARAKQLTQKYRLTLARRKRQTSTATCPMPRKQLRLQDDPLNLATRAPVGRPKGKRKDTASRSDVSAQKPPCEPSAFMVVLM